MKAVGGGIQKHNGLVHGEETRQLRGRYDSHEKASGCLIVLLEFDVMC